MTQAQAIRECIRRDTLFATRYFFAQQTGRIFNVGEHHKQMAQALDDVFNGKCKRLIINVPPRYSKTEMLKAFIEKGLGLYPKSKYIMVSYSANLALDNSEYIRNVCSSDWYRDVFPEVEIRKDSRSKHKWYTTQGGGIYAVSSQGQITGFGAGLVRTDKADLQEFLTGKDTEPGTATEIEDKHAFGGAIVIDDPMKVLDAESPLIRQKVIDIFENTIRSRVNDRDTPIILIMQRLHKDDLAGHLQREGEKDDWRVISLPAIVTDPDTGEERSLYPFKYTLEELVAMRAANRYMFETQYQQNPQSINDKRWVFAYSESRNAGHTEYKPTLPLYLSFDFNRNPMTCSIWQIQGVRVACIDTIRIENATTRMVCQEIERRYPKAMMMITGDCAGNNATTMAQINNYDEIRMYFRLGQAAMQVGRTNPPLAQSRLFVNNCFERYDIVIDKDRCKPLIFDIENVMSDEDNKPIKDNRGNAAQQADFLDNMRYFLHRFYSQFTPAN